MCAVFRIPAELTVEQDVLQYSTLGNEKGRWAVIGRLRNGPLSSAVTESDVDAKHR